MTREEREERLKSYILENFEPGVDLPTLKNLSDAVSINKVYVSSLIRELRDKEILIQTQTRNYRISENYRSNETLEYIKNIANKAFDVARCA